MNEQEETAKEGKAVGAFRSELMNANFDGAKVIEREQAIPLQAINSIINSIYDIFIQTQRHKDAIELGKRYDLPKDKINDAIYMEFRKVIGSGDFEKAIEWAMVYNLPQYEINRAAIKGIENAIMSGDIELAVEIKKKYSISEEQIGSVWQSGFDLAFKEAKYYEAALLSREFGMSERKTILTAAKGFRQAINESNFDRMIQIDGEFRIFNDESFPFLGEEEGRSLIKATEYFLKKQFRSENFRKAMEVVHGLGILYKDIHNHTLRDIWHFAYNQAIEIHRMFLHDNRYDDAFWLYGEYHLNEENTPEKIRREIFDQAINYHNRLLGNGNISSALQVLNDYDLMGMFSNRESIDLIQNAAIDLLGELIQKGETQVGNEIIKEYNIPQEDTAAVVRNAVIDSLNKNNFDQAMDIVEKFDVRTDDFDIKAAAKTAFDYCCSSGYMETAADVGYIFQLDIPEVKNAALTVWEKFIENQEYKKAASLKRKHKLSKKMTEKIAKSEYHRLVQLNDVEKAQKLRDEYRVSIGIFSLIIEFFKKLMLIFFGGDKTDKTLIDMTPAENTATTVSKE